MKKNYVLFLIFLGVFCGNGVQGQTVTPIDYYPMVNWDTSPYQSFRYTRENAQWDWLNFRLLFPTSFDSAAENGKKYPLVIMLHGAGESGLVDWGTKSPYPAGDPRIHNNDHQLLFGGREHLAAVNSGRFPGFVMFPQNYYGTWYNSNGEANTTMRHEMAKLMEIIEYLIAESKVDPDRIYIHGLSNGAGGTWYAAYKRPDLFAAALPMSHKGDPAMAEQIAEVPLWVFQGDLDTNPRPIFTEETIEAVRDAGGTVRYTKYQNTTHNTWNKAYAEPDFFEWMLSQQKSDSVNFPPIVNAGADTVISLPVDSLTLTAVASDPNGSVNKFLWEQLNGPAVSLLNESTYQLTIKNLVAGNYTYRVTVTDDAGLTASDELSVVVEDAPNPNEAPLVSAGNDRTVVLPVDTTSFTALAYDEDGEILSFLWEKVSGPAVTMAGDSATLYLSALVEGSYLFRVTVVDDAGAPASDEVALIVEAAEPENTMPLVNAGPDKSVTLPTDSISLAATATDEDGTIVSYLWERLSGPSVTMAGDTTAVLSLANLVSGSYSFTVTVTDNDGATASDQVIVQVKEASSGNLVPTANAGADKTITLPVNEIDLRGQARDEDGRFVRFGWEKVSGPSVTMVNAGTANAKATDLVEGVYVFRFSATDDDGATGTDDMTLTVLNQNTPVNKVPMVNAGSDKALTLPTNSTNLSATATDEDGTIVSYLWEKLSGPSATMAGDTTAVLSLANLISGSYSFKVTVTDNDGATASDQVIVQVKEASSGNLVPTANAGSDKTITLPVNEIDLRGQARDEDGRFVRFGWEKVSGPSVTMVGAGTANAKATDLVEGVYVFRFSATDNDGATGTDDMTLTVLNQNTPVNKVPMVNAGSDKALTLPTNSTNLSATATDEDGTIVSYLWEKLSGPSATMAGDTTAILSLSNLVSGSYSFKVTVTDNDGATASDQVIVQVKEANTGNLVPTANAGSDKTITLPVNEIDLRGQARDEDGRFVRFGWEKVSGPSVTMVGAGTANAKATNLIEGIYVFRFSATDNDGATGTDEMTLTVLAGSEGAVAMNTEVQAARITAYPNTFVNDINVEIQAEEGDKYELTVFTLLGKVIHQSEIEVGMAGTTNGNIDFAGIQPSAGNYLLQVKNFRTGQKEIIRIVKK